MAYRVDAAVDPVEPTGRHPVFDGLLPQPHRKELPVPDDPVLPRSELRDLSIPWAV